MKKGFQQRGLSASPRKARRGFTLVEVLIASSVSLLVIGGALSVMLAFSKSSLAIEDYHRAASQDETLIERFAQDARYASGLDWTSSTQISLETAAGTVTYAYDTGSKVLWRSIGSGATQYKRLRGFRIHAFDHAGTELSADEAEASPGSIKMLQLVYLSEISAVGNRTSTLPITSARTLLRSL